MRPSEGSRRFDLVSGTTGRAPGWMVGEDARVRKDAAAVASDPAAARRVDRDVGRIDAAAAKMAALLEDLLALSRIGRQTGRLEEVTLGEIAREAQELVAGAIAQGGVEVEIASDLPAVCGDRARLVELMQNLIENAVRYMGELGAAGCDGRIMRCWRLRSASTTPRIRSGAAR